MRVARIITRLNIGGPAIQAINLSARLTERGVDTLLVHGTVGDREGDMSYLLASATPRPTTMSMSVLQRRPAPADDARALWQLYRMLSRFRPDIVHTHMAKAGALGRLAAAAYNRTVGRRHRARIVHTYHGHVLEGYFGRAATAAFVGIERGLAGVTDRLVAVSPRVKKIFSDGMESVARSNTALCRLDSTSDSLPASTRVPVLAPASSLPFRRTLMSFRPLAGSRR